MSGKSSSGFNRAGGGAADGSGGFAPVTGATLEDGLPVAEVFTELGRALIAAGYRKEWVDGWVRGTDGAVVTSGYSYREVRVRRYLPGHKERQPQAIHNVRRYHDLERIEAFVGPPVENWGDWAADVDDVELVAY